MVRVLRKPRASMYTLKHTQHHYRKALFEAILCSVTNGTLNIPRGYVATL